MMHQPSLLARFLLALSVMCCLALGMPCAHAQMPHLVRYQGQAMDSKGVPLEGPYTLTFRLYDAQTAGNKLWEERQTSVPLSSGHFSVLLGQITPLTSIDWSKACWLSVQINTDPELAPRQQITSVPLAIRSETAETAELVKTSGLTDDANRLVPSGAIILWEGTSCPTGYTRDAGYDGKFLIGSDTAGTMGGSNTHAHGAGSYAGPSHTHTVSSKGWGAPGVNDTSQSPGWLRLMNAGMWGGSVDGSLDTNKETSASGTGAVTGTSASADSRPEFKTILLCKKN